MSPLRYAEIDCGLHFFKIMLMFEWMAVGLENISGLQVSFKNYPLPDNGRYFAIAERFDSKTIIFPTVVKMIACLYVEILHLHLPVLSLWHLPLS